MQPATRGDGVRLQLSGADCISMRVVGALAGIAVLAAGARNGPGTGRIIASAGGYLAWQAPNSATPGTPQPVSSIDGPYLLEDGDDVTKWIRVQVYNAFLPTAGEARIFIADTYAVDVPGVGVGDIDAATAATGTLETTQFALKNVSPVRVDNIKLWIDRSGVQSRGVTVSSDGITYVNPGSEVAGNVLLLGSLAPGASVSVWMQQTIAVAATFDPGRLNILQFGWDGL